MPEWLSKAHNESSTPHTYWNKVCYNSVVYEIWSPCGNANLLPWTPGLSSPQWEWPLSGQWNQWAKFSWHTSEFLQRWDLTPWYLQGCTCWQRYSSHDTWIGPGEEMGYILITATGTGKHILVCYCMHIDHKLSNTNSHINQENGDCQTRTSQMFCAHLLYTLIPILWRKAKLSL